MRANLFLKVEVDLDPGEQPEQLAEEICRQVRRVYGVREAELSHVTRENG